MKVTFLLPDITLRGGVRAVLAYSDLMAAAGADVTVAFPTRLRRLPFPVNEIEYLWRAPYKLLFRRWFRTRARLLPVPALQACYLPRADAVVATAWQTAVALATFPARLGEKYYFVQDIETYTDRDAGAGATYRLPLRRIADSPWVRDRLERQFGSAPWALVPHGVDLDAHRPFARRERSCELTVGLLVSDERRKGTDVALDAVRALSREGHDFRLLCVGVQRRPPPLPPGTELLWKVAPHAMPALYGRAHVWVCPSRADGMPLPPMEAMASGCALVTTRVGGTSYYAIPESTALVCEPGDAAGLRDALRRALVDPALRAGLAERGVERIRALDIRATAANLLRAVAGERVFVEPATALTETHCA